MSVSRFRSLSTPVRIVLLTAAAFGAICIWGSVLIVNRFVNLNASPITGRMVQSVSGKGRFVISRPEWWQFGDTSGTGPDGDSSVVAYIAYGNFPKIGPLVEIRRSSATYRSGGEVAAWGEQIASELPGYSEISVRPTRIGIEETILREYTYLPPSAPIFPAERRRCLDSYRLHDGVGYVLSMCVEASDFGAMRPVFLEMMASFAYVDS